MSTLSKASSLTPLKVILSNSEIIIDIISKLNTLLLVIDMKLQNQTSFQEHLQQLLSYTGIF